MDTENQYALKGSVIIYDGKPLSMDEVIGRLNTLERFETGYGGGCWACEPVAKKNIAYRKLFVNHKDGDPTNNDLSNLGIGVTR